MVGNDSDGACGSLPHLQQVIEELLRNEGALAGVLKLTIIGQWTASADDTPFTEDGEDWNLVTVRSRSSSNSEGLGIVIEHRIRMTNEEIEWRTGVQYIATLVQKMENLQSFAWTTTLPFSASLWPALPQTLHNLTLDISLPYRPDSINITHSSPFFAQDDLKSLCSFTELRSLGIYGMMESFQPTIWETVWRNPNLYTLDLRMALEPIVRASDQHGEWLCIDEGWSVDMPGRSRCSAPIKYLGNDGVGTLHHIHGHGEYLDVLAIRKARIAACIHDQIDSLPLVSLRLEGFVVDACPFERGFGRLREIKFGRDCIDAGFELPVELRGMMVRAPGMGDESGGGEGAEAREGERAGCGESMM
ncbi:hypothetical protein H2201_006669 [Coniosporium apollinis]|uniref:Alpha-galactosidase n=1 Tax=Coniosporium apollinis TaxID=61459 RepID=A0ABQ9NL98_9PEZI|nr:hypothetical protein H2201_006669 [Coniosporium apollinis]